LDEASSFSCARGIKPHFEITKDAAGEYRFRLRAPNGEIIAVSENYKSKDGCKSVIVLVKEIATKAVVKDLTVE
jgi:uncharacterized protein YegP (UPF0339 family)